MCFDAAGTVLHDAGDVIDAWYIILSGKLRSVQPHGMSSAVGQLASAPVSNSGIGGGTPRDQGDSLHQQSVAATAAPKASNSTDTKAVNFHAHASPANSSVCLMPGVTGALEQQPVMMADFSSSREKHYECKAICITDCELAVLCRSELVALVAQQQEHLMARWVKVLRENAVFATRTVGFAQRVAECCRGVQAGAGSLVMLHNAATATAADVSSDSNSSSCVVDPNTPRSTAAGNCSNQQLKQHRQPALITGQGYAFVAAGECRVVCKVLLNRSRQAPVTAAAAASAKASYSSVHGDTDAARSSTTLAGHATVATPVKAGLMAVAVPVLQLGPGDVLATAALAACEAAEVSAVCARVCAIYTLGRSIHCSIATKTAGATLPSEQSMYNSHAISLATVLLSCTVAG